MTHNDFLLSVIVPVYNEEQNIDTIHTRLRSALKSQHFEIIFVDDGSTDQTAHNVKSLASSHPEVKLISFTRNFGHQMALSAGYKYASGRAVVSIDADLQDPPELITHMIAAWRDGAKIVYARRSARHGESGFKKSTATWFYGIINRLSEVHIPPNVGDFRLLDRVVVDFLNELPEKSRFLRGLVAWSGYRSATVDFERAPRHTGHTHYPLKKMLSFAVSGIIAFSTKPLHLVTYFGLTTAALGFAGMLYALARRVILPHEFWVTGWTALFVSIMFFSGVQMLVLGVISEYIGQLFKQAQDRPMYLVREKVGFE